MILNESSRDNLLLPYVEMLKAKGKEVTVSQLKQFLLAKFVNEAYIRNLSLESNYYLAGVARYYFEGKLTENQKLNVFYSKIKDVFNREVCQKINALILVLRNSYIDSIGTKFEQPEDFGTLPLEKLLRKYGSAIKKELSNSPEEIQKKIDNLNRDNNVGNGYTYEILYSYSDARKYNSATEPGAWCITYGEHHYSYYVNSLHIHYVIFAKKGYEKIPRKKTEGWTPEKPQDEYGNSLIALLQSNKDWRPIYITSRWNHGSESDNSSCEADHAYTTEEFFKKTGVTAEDLKRIYEIWNADKPETEDDKTIEEPKNKELMRKFKYAQMKLNGGNFENLFGDDICVTVKNLSNCKSIKEIHEKVNGGLSDEEIALLQKKEQKIIRNSVTLNKVDLFGFTYFFLRDGNKILFETIFKSSNIYLDMRNMYTSSDECEELSSFVFDNVRNKHNLISIARPSTSSYSMRDASYFLLYDYRKHAFVEIEGVRKFKKIAEVSRTDSLNNGYYEIANSTKQRALVDINTNIPLKMPNGRCWFEYSNTTKGSTDRYSRRVDARCHNAKNGIIKITVDSSSGEAYFYDMQNKKFFEPILPPQPENNSNYDREKELKTTFVEKNWNMPPNCCILDVGYTHRYSCIYYNGSPVEIDGEMFFNYVNYTQGGYVFIINPLGEKPTFLYDISSKTHINVPDGIDVSKLTVRNSNYANNERIVFDTGSYYSSDPNIIYDCRFKTFLKNPFDGSYFFRVYIVGTSSNTIKIYKDNDKDSKLTYVVSLDPKEPKFNVEVGEDGQPLFYKTTLYETKGSIYSIGFNDIRKMVLEIINKI